MLHHQSVYNGVLRFEIPISLIIDCQTHRTRTDRDNLGNPEDAV
jgi:hypothetical protein